MSALALAKAELPDIRLRAKRFGETSPELEEVGGRARIAPL